MLSQSNIKPYVSLLWLLITGVEQSIGTIREVLRGGAGCEIKGLWRKYMSALIRSYSLVRRREKKNSSSGTHGQAHTHTHTQAYPSPPHDQKVECVHIFSRVVPLCL